MQRQSRTPMPVVRCLARPRWRQAPVRIRRARAMSRAPTRKSSVARSDTEPPARYAANGRARRRPAAGWGTVALPGNARVAAGVVDLVEAARIKFAPVHLRAEVPDRFTQTADPRSQRRPGDSTLWVDRVSQ